jgi:hypothetical protein
MIVSDAMGSISHKQGPEGSEAALREQRLGFYVSFIGGNQWVRMDLKNLRPGRGARDCDTAARNVLVTLLLAPRNRAVLGLGLS